MPVLAEQSPYGYANLLSIDASYLFLGAIVILATGILINRRRRARQFQSLPQHGYPSEKAYSNPTSIAMETQSAAKPRIPRATQSPQPLLHSPETSASFDSFEPLLEMPPRRRSYTKNTPEGGEVSGEIVVAEGWRRHTRVFGGGVCKACEESERRMSA